MTDYAVVNPADNQKVREFEAHTDDQIRQMLDRAHAAQQAPHRRTVTTHQFAELPPPAGRRKGRRTAGLTCSDSWGLRRPPAWSRRCSATDP